MNPPALIGAGIAASIALVLWAVVAWRRRIRITNLTEWSIGIYCGDSPLTLKPVAHVANPVLTAADATDVKAQFVADPFLFKFGATWHLFCEVYNSLENRGQIGLASSADGLHYSYERIVLAEPFHLSYPHVFSWNDDIYMIPESAAAGSVRLYRASPFPYTWAFTRELLKGPFCDSTVIRFKDTWWIFTCFEPSGHKDLHLFFSDALGGPYTEHPQSPVVKGDGHHARPGGRFLVEGERIVRFAQDCQPTYGKNINAFEIIKLTKSEYQEREFKANPILKASGAGWNRHGMHHLDPHKLDDGTWIACVDGYKKSYSVQVEY